MKNKYLFIVWNKALFCKDKITNDLKQSFVIEKYFYVCWEKDKFIADLKALYGFKSADVQEKAHYVGNGKFLVIIVSDNEPEFDYVDSPEGKELVNIRIYKKKKLYRKWTAGNFRVHSSTNETETRHDLSILFGPDYENLISSINDKETLKLDTIGVRGFQSSEELCRSLDLLGNSKHIAENEVITVFTDYRVNAVYMICPDKEYSENTYGKLINNKEYILDIFGEKEGDLPEGLVEKINDKTSEEFLVIKGRYKEYLKNRKEMDSEISEFLDRNGFTKEFEARDAMRDIPRKGFIEIVKNKVKYIIAFILNR